MQYLPKSHPLSNKVLSELGSDVKYIVEGKSGSFEVLFSTGEIKESTKKKPTPYGLLLTKNELLNVFLPQEVDQGIQLAEVIIKGRALKYKYILDEDLYDMNLLEASKDNIYESCYNEVYGNITEEFNELCNRCLDDIVYDYIGNTTGQKVEVTIETQSKQK